MSPNISETKEVELRKDGRTFKPREITYFYYYLLPFVINVSTLRLPNWVTSLFIDHDLPFFANGCCSAFF